MQEDRRKAKIPVCPLMSAGQEISIVCLQEKCAWYMTSTETCAAYVIAHNNILEIKQKQGK